jgi:aryl-alcohol dehydrogenase-like predicted oxidoreductase
MQVTLPGTEIRVSRIAFGTASLHHLFSTSGRQALLHAASDAGMTHFDTSPYYGYGLAEADLRRFIRGRRAGLTLTTKVGLYPWGYSDRSASTVWARKALGKLVTRMSLPVVNWEVAQARASLDGSLRRLGTDYVDFLFLHEPEQALMETDEMLGWLAAEQDAGRIRAWGLAGVADRVAPFVRAGHPLAKVVQTQDSIDLHQADFMMASGRDLQLTYGYLSSCRAANDARSPQDVMRGALERNQTGAVLVSTRRVERIGMLARLVV